MTLRNTVNLCSLNVNGANHKEKRKRVIEWIKAQKSSISFIQETHFDEKIERELKNKSDFDLFCSHGTSSSRGVAIFIKKSLEYELVSKFNDTDGRYVLLNVNINSTIFT